MDPSEQCERSDRVSPCFTVAAVGEKMLTVYFPQTNVCVCVCVYIYGCVCICLYGIHGRYNSNTFLIGKEIHELSLKMREK